MSSFWNSAPSVCNSSTQADITLMTSSGLFSRLKEAPAEPQKTLHCTNKTNLHVWKSVECFIKTVGIFIMLVLFRKSKGNEVKTYAARLVLNIVWNDDILSIWRREGLRQSKTLKHIQCVYPPLVGYRWSSQHVTFIYQPITSDCPSCLWTVIVLVYPVRQKN